MRVVLRGRSAEMTAALEPLCRAGRTGRGGMLLVTGEPGIGTASQRIMHAARSWASLLLGDPPPHPNR